MRGTWTPPTVLTVSPEHSWRWRESNPRPSVHHQGFSGRSLRCFSQPRRSCRLAADGLSRCWCPAQPRDRAERWILLADARHRAGGVPGLTTLLTRVRPRVRGYAALHWHLLSCGHRIYEVMSAVLGPLPLDQLPKSKPVTPMFSCLVSPAVSQPQPSPSFTLSCQRYPANTDSRPGGSRALR